jgi:hypothetical protein
MGVGEVEQTQGYPYWRAVVSFLLDFICAVLVFGFGLAFILGKAAVQGATVRFHFQGWPALLFMLLVIAYFVVFNRFLGGTIWRRALGVGPRH